MELSKEDKQNFARERQNLLENLIKNCDSLLYSVDLLLNHDVEPTSDNFDDTNTTTNTTATTTFTFGYDDPERRVIHSAKEKLKEEFMDNINLIRQKNYEISQLNNDNKTINQEIKQLQPIFKLFRAEKILISHSKPSQKDKSDTHQLQKMKFLNESKSFKQFIEKYQIKETDEWFDDSTFISRLVDFISNEETDHLFKITIIYSICDSDFRIQCFLNNLQQNRSNPKSDPKSKQRIEELIQFWIKYMRMSFNNQIKDDFLYKILQLDENHWILDDFDDYIKSFLNKASFPSRTEIVFSEDAIIFNDLLEKLKSDRTKSSENESYEMKFKEDKTWREIFNRYQKIPNIFDPRIETNIHEKYNVENISNAFNFIFGCFFNMFSLDFFVRGRNEGKENLDLLDQITSLSNGITFNFVDFIQSVHQDSTIPKNDLLMKIGHRLIDFRTSLAKKGNYFAAENLKSFNCPAADYIDRKLEEEGITDQIIPRKESKMIFNRTNPITFDESVLEMENLFIWEFLRGFSDIAKSYDTIKGNTEKSLFNNIHMYHRIACLLELIFGIQKVFGPDKIDHDVLLACLKSMINMRRI
ncbi:hypothetical protein TRFO_10393 [Tritrichomonas foetus]|uniref:Uncharacterized protein n=1 Tax=Tritrichomonas foetus TaxID=1144522 RepID=A0A1J4J9B3_9EUKA|nr:hypothetical protein TRFO_10393 [Tritrichomonas foetus]|eukprot:OHS95736.1 hypothetical protein TRFO_10393 [Tritrichomonas foetus]